MLYRRGTYGAQILHAIKYKGASRLARYLGDVMCRELYHTGVLNGPEVITYVPLHPFRMMQRGYNQSRRLAQGVAGSLGLPVVGMLRASAHRRQTHLGREGRLKNAHGVFRAKLSGPWKHRALNFPPHVLLVDDVCTTGATLADACRALAQAMPAVKISILTLAMTSEL